MTAQADAASEAVAPAPLSKQSDVVIVHHRQPCEEEMVHGRVARRENESPDGIAPTLESFCGVGKGAWVARRLAEQPADPGLERREEITDAYGTYVVSRLPLREDQVRGFYRITSKEACWPTLHCFKEKYDYDPGRLATFPQSELGLRRGRGRGGGGGHRGLDPRLRPPAPARISAPFAAR
ncbi:MAG: hypothetical protein R6V44_12230 [Paracoccaceae bacterium]